MKTLKTLLPALLMISLAHSAAFAGGNASGGGTGIVTPKGKVELLDLLEERDNLEKDFKKFDPRQEKAFRAEIETRFNKIEELVPIMKGQTQAALDEILDKANFYFTDKKLNATNDTCLLTKENTAQLAVQKAGKIVVNQGLYQKADAKTQGALLVHEIVMQVLQRPACSDEVRKAVRMIMSPEKFSAKELSTEFFEKILGRRVPKVAYEPNIPSSVENRFARPYIWSQVTAATMNGDPAYSSERACFERALQDLSVLDKDPDVLKAIDQVRIEKRADQVQIKFFSGYDGNGLAMFVKTADENEEMARRDVNLNANEDGSTDDYSISLSQYHRGDVTKMVQRGKCNVSKSSMLELLNGYRLPAAKKPKPAKEERNVENCMKKSEELIKNLSDRRQGIVTQFPESWIRQLNLKLNERETMGFWDRWSLSSCEEKRNQLEEELENLGDVVTTLQQKRQASSTTEIVPSVVNGIDAK